MSVWRFHNGLIYATINLKKKSFRNNTVFKTICVQLSDSLVGSLVITKAHRIEYYITDYG
jgi:hypothetical protein